MSDETKPFTDKHYKRTLSFEYGTIGPEHEADCLEAICEGMVRANQIMIRAQPDAYPCCLGCSGYRYVNPQNCRTFNWRRGHAPKVDPNCQHVFGAFGLQRRRAGTCIDLACMAAAIYREKENDPNARVIIEFQFGDVIDVDEEGEEIRERLDGLYHAMVKLGDGTIVDPTEKVLQPDKPKPAEAEVCGCSAA